jgi:hypothetical protein
MNRIISALLIAGFSAAVLTGCAASTNKTYSSVSDLKADFVLAGGDCEDWIQSDQVTAALESGECGSTTVLSIYSDQAAARESAENLASILRDYGMPISVLYGKNWVINSKQASSLSERITGTLITG